MPRYKLRVPEEGAILHGDGFGAVAATKEAAREHLEDYTGEPVPYLHSYIGSCRVVYQRDVDGGDCHDDAEAGDTTVDYSEDDGRELRPGEIRVWQIGAPRLARWRMEANRTPVDAADIPVGVTVHHERLGSGRTISRSRRIYPKCWYVDVEFGAWPRGDQPARTVAVRVTSPRVFLLPSRIDGRNWPPVRYRLTINGEHVADGSEQHLRDLVDIREARLRAEWEAEQDREREVTIA